MSQTARLIAISVGNSRTALGLFSGSQMEKTERFTNADAGKIIERLRSWLGDAEAGDETSILLASVNDQIASRLTDSIAEATSHEVCRVGTDVAVPIGQQLDPETLTGVDRLLNAAAAFDQLKQACVIVDAGTAVTVDFVDGEGTFHGGAIAPGAAMQMKAMHDHTAALPELKFQPPDASEPFGRNTAQAMYQGVYHGIRGLVQRLVERYAEAYGAFPMVIATGGDAQVLFHDDPLVDRIVPDLTLLGIASAAKYALAGDDSAPTSDAA